MSKCKVIIDALLPGVWQFCSGLLGVYGSKLSSKRYEFVTCNCNYETECITGILEQLTWESLNKRKIVSIDRGAAPKKKRKAK